MKRLLLCLVVMACLLPAVVQAGQTIFCDDFNSYTPGLNWNGAGVWTISDGTVDLIGEGTSWNWFPANGRYVDMDGSTSNAGMMSTSFDLNPGSYVISYELAGNQRLDRVDTVNVSVSFGSDWSISHSLAYNQGFTQFSQVLTLTEATTAILSFEGVGGDNVGMLLDNVCIEAQAVPAPGAMLLGSMGTALVSWLRRRKAL